MAAPRSSRDLLRLVLVALVLGLLFWLVPVDRLKALLDVEALRAEAAAGGPRIVGVYLGGVALLTLMTGQFFAPVVAGAALFGFLLGPVLAVLGVAIGSVGQFLLVRYALRAPAERFLTRRLPALRDAIAARGLALLVFLRFIWFPGLLTTAGAALSPLSLRAFLLGFPAMLPQAIIVGFATDAIVTFGWRDVPLLRWLAFVGMLVVAIGAYVGAVRRWPQLRAITRRSKESP